MREHSIHKAEEFDVAGAGHAGLIAGMIDEWFKVRGEGVDGKVKKRDWW